VNVGLRTLHERLAGTGDPVAVWRRFISAAERCRTPAGRVASGFHDISAPLGLRGGDGEWFRDLRQLGVVHVDGTWDGERARAVGVALELVGDSFDIVGPTATWAPVATLPREVARTLRLPALRQTAGVLLELIDGAVEEVVLAAPYVDAPGVETLHAALSAARMRGVDLTVITSLGRGVVFASLASLAAPAGRGGLRVAEVRTDVSPLGSHAKLLVADRRRAYIGSANFTAAGFGRNVEVGVRVEGAQVDEVARLLDALARCGTLVTPADAAS